MKLIFVLLYCFIIIVPNVFTYFFSFKTHFYFSVAKLFPFFFKTRRRETNKFKYLSKLKLDFWKTFLFLPLIIALNTRIIVLCDRF